MNIRLALLCVTLIIALPLTSVAQSQLANGSIVITAVDSAGAVMPGVIVRLLNKDTGFVRSVYTNDEGRGISSLLPLGSYEITAQKPGFSIMKVNDLQLQVGEQRVPWLECGHL